MPGIFWILIGDKETGSSRIHGLNIHKKLKKLKFNSKIIIAPDPWMNDIPFNFDECRKYFNFLTSKDILIIQKVCGANTIKLIQHLSIIGVSIYFIDSDLPLKIDIIQHLNNFISPSKKLIQEYKKINSSIKNYYYIPDCPEYFISKPIKKRSSKLKCVWFGYYDENKWNDLLQLKKLLINELSNHWKLISISNTNRADYLWNNKSAINIISRCDAVVIPVFNNSSYSQMKSSNKVLQSMAINVPVLVSPLESYKEIIDNGHNGFICYNEKDWVNNLEILQDKGKANYIRKNGYNTALKFSLDLVINEWITNLGITHEHKIKLSIRQYFSLNILRSIFYYYLLYCGKVRHKGSFLTKLLFTNPWLFSKLIIETLFTKFKSYVVDP